MKTAFVFLTLTGRRLMLAALLGGMAAATAAPQSIDLSLQARGTFTRAIFDFGRPAVDVVSPPQTGLASSALFAATPAIGALTADNPFVGVQARWDPAAMTLGLDTGVAAAYWGGTELSLTLPQGTGTGALVFSNAAGGLRSALVGDDARAVSPADFLFLPGNVDLVGIGMDGNFGGAGWQVSAPPVAPVVVDLLADPMFLASYSGNGSPGGLTELRVRITPGAVRTLVAGSLTWADLDGDALAGRLPPATLDLGAFGPAEVALRFTGNASASLDRLDYASEASFDAARAFWATSGIRRVGVEEYAVWGVTPVPEPGTWLLLAAGLGVVAQVVRARPGHAPADRHAA